MPHDPLTPFDFTVLDLIEHSPTGAVPHTPAYQDSLRRLSAAQQTYPSSDYKDGYVTARSLAKLPVFFAENIDELATKAETVPEANDAIYSRYVMSLPEAFRARAEASRTVVAGRTVHHRAKHGAAAAHDPVHSLFLVPGAGPHHGLPGNYVYGFVAQGGSRWETATWSLDLHDCEDGLAVYRAASLQDALAKLHELLDSAPFHLSELDGLGFVFP